MGRTEADRTRTLSPEAVALDPLALLAETGLPARVVLTVPGAVPQAPMVVAVLRTLEVIAECLSYHANRLSPRPLLLLSRPILRPRSRDGQLRTVTVWCSALVAGTKARSDGRVLGAMP